MKIEFEAARVNLPNYIYTEYQINHSAVTHFHSCYEVLICTSGQLEVQVDGEKYLIKENDAVLVFPNQIHSNHTIQASENFVCVFSWSYIEDFNTECYHLRPKSPVFRLEPTVCREVLAILQNPDSNKYERKSVFYKLAAELVRQTTFIKKTDHMNEPVVNLLIYICDNWREDITLKDIAVALNINYNHLSFLFNKTFNKRFSVFLNEIRISNAMEMISNSRKKPNFSDIAINCGFSNIRTFNRNFTAIVEKSPTEYWNDCQI